MNSIEQFSVNGNENGLYEVLKDAFYQPTMIKVITKINDWINDGCKVFAYLEDEELLGAIIVRESTSEVIIECIGVNNRRRGSGIGSELVKYIQGICCKQLFAETDDSAIGFYRKIGFNSNKVVKHYKNGDIVRYECGLMKKMF